jgi:tight adherence protein C
MALLVLISVLLIGAAVALAGRAAIFPRVRTASRVQTVTSYGFATVPTAEDDRVERPIEGLAQRVGDAVAGQLSNVREDSLRAELMSAGMYRMSPRALLGYRVIAAIGLPALILWVGAGSSKPVLVGLAAAASVAAGWMLPLMLVRRRARLRKQKVDREVPDFIDLLVVTVESGQGLGGAIGLAGERIRGPLGDEVRLAVQEQAMGLSAHDALTNMVERCDTPALRSFVRSVVQGESLGVSIGEILRAVAVEMRKRRRQSAEEQAQKAPVKMLFPLAFLIFPSLFIIILGPSIFDLLHTLGGLN